MSVEFAPEFEERIGVLLDQVSALGYPEIHGALATFVRERRGRVRAGAWPRGIARELERFVDELEELVSQLKTSMAPSQPTTRTFEALPTMSGGQRRE